MARHNMPSGIIHTVLLKLLVEGFPVKPHYPCCRCPVAFDHFQHVEDGLVFDLFHDAEFVGMVAADEKDGKWDKRAPDIASGAFFSRSADRL